MPTTWIELKEGCEMPDYDVPVLWRREDGNYFVRDIDKDDDTWWHGHESDDVFQCSTRCTHYRYIDGPSEEPNQDDLFGELEAIIDNELLKEYGPHYMVSAQTIKYLKDSYTLIRK